MYKKNSSNKINQSLTLYQNYYYNQIYLKEQPWVNLLPDSDADNDVVEVNDSCVFKYEFENDISN